MSTYYVWKDEDESYKDKHEKAKRIIGRRLEKDAFKNHLSTNSVNAFILPHYLKRWEQQVEWRNRLKIDDQQLSGIRVVEVPVYLNAPIVQTNNKNDQ